MYRIIMVLSVIAAIGFAVGINKRRVKYVVTVPVLMIIIGLVGSGAGLLVQNLVVTPDEINKESQYLESNIEFTQAAYGLDNVDTREFAASNDLTSEDISNNDETISNIRINDYEPTNTCLLYTSISSRKEYLYSAYRVSDVEVLQELLNGRFLKFQRL